MQKKKKKKYIWIRVRSWALWGTSGTNSKVTSHQAGGWARACYFLSPSFQINLRMLESFESKSFPSNIEGLNSRGKRLVSFFFRKLYDAELATLWRTVHHKTSLAKPKEVWTESSAANRLDCMALSLSRGCKWRNVKLWRGCGLFQLDPNYKSYQIGLIDAMLLLFLSICVDWSHEVCCWQKMWLQLDE